MAKNIKRDRATISKDQTRELDQAAKTISKTIDREVDRHEVAKRMEKLNTNRRDLVYADFKAHPEKDND